MYLPDFKLGIGRDGKDTLWIEVKPDGENAPIFIEFMENLTEECQGSVFGSIPESNKEITGNLFHCWGISYSLDYEVNQTWDNCHTFGQCNRCRSVLFRFYPESSVIGCCHASHMLFHSPLIKRAFKAGRSARFEHGESGYRR
jgi:hypothetical protein